jgi:hypothetical protein
VPRIADSYTGCAVYVYATLEDARTGESINGAGSGLLVCVPINSDFAAGYVVTNRHVVTKAGSPVLRLNRKDGGVECIRTNLRDWFMHPGGDDVAVFPLDIEWEDLKFTFIQQEIFLTPEIIAAEDVGIGDDTVMVGRFIGHDGKQKNTPAVRFGNIAMMPIEKIVSEAGIAQESFLVEMRSLPGYSGSAVFIYSPCAMNDMSVRRSGKTHDEDEAERMKEKEEKGWAIPSFPLSFTRPKGPFLLGVDWCHLHSRSYVRGGDGKVLDDRTFVEQNSGIAGVIPAWKIADVLNSEELVAMRRKEDEKITQKKAESRVSLDYAETREARRPDEPFTQEDFEAALKKTSRKTGGK